MAAININHQEFKELLQQEKPVLVDFWAPWCGYCRRIGPAYEKIAEGWSEDVVVAKVNIDDEAALSDLEKIEVIPTLVLYQGGQAVASIVAPESKAQIEDFLRRGLRQ